MGSSAEHTALKRAALGWLAASGYLAWDNQTGAAWRDGRFVRYGKRGSGDIVLVLPGGRHGEAEAKTGGADQSKEQRVHQRVVERNGGLYVVFRSVEELAAALTSAGHPPPQKGGLSGSNS